MKKKFLFLGVSVGVICSMLYHEGMTFDKKTVEVYNQQKLEGTETFNVNTSIPDANFRKCIAEMLITGSKQEYDYLTESYWKDDYTYNGTSYKEQVNTDGSNLTQELLKEVTKLQCPSKGITNLKGIEYLPNLWTINLDNNKINTVHFESATHARLHSLNFANTGLTSLTVDDTLANQINHIDVGGNKLGNTIINGYISRFPNLTGLAVGTNDLTGTLDVSSLTKLDGLYANGNKLTSVKGIGDKKLRYLVLNDNQISSIDLKNNTDLIVLQIANNKLSNIDLSENVSLLSLWLNNNNFTTVNLNANTNLKDLNLSENKLKNVTIKSSNLGTVYLSNVEFSSLDLPEQSKLRILDITNCKIVQEEIQNLINRFPTLTDLSINYNSLSSLNISKLSELQNLHAHHNAIKTLDLSSNSKLNEVLVHDNKLTSLKVPTTCDSLKTLNLSVNNLESLNTSNCNNLEHLYVTSNGELKTLTLPTSGEKLLSLGISLDDSLTIPALDKYKSLKELSISSDMASKIDFSKLTGLTALDYDYYSIIPIYGTSITKSAISKYTPSNIGLSTDIKFQKNFFGTTELTADPIEGNPGNYVQLRLVSTGAINSSAKNIAYTVSQKYTGWHEVRFIKLLSDHYEINEETSTIDVGGDTDDQIKEKLKIQFGAIITIEDTKLTVSYNGKAMREFKLLRTENPKTGEMFLYVTVFLAIMSIVLFNVFYKKKLHNKI